MAILFKPEDVKITSESKPMFSHKKGLGAEAFFYGGGGFSGTDTSLPRGNPYISTTATLNAGANAAALSASKDWTIGFIQMVDMQKLFYGYSGASYLLGSIGINLLPEGPLAAPDAHGERDKVLDPSTAAARPFTKSPTDRFTFDSASGQITAGTVDGPFGNIRQILSNSVTHVDNYLRTIVDHRRFCCALVIEEPKPALTRTVISHQIWDLRFVAEMKWKNKTISEVNSTGTRLDVGKFVAGAPVDPSFAKIVDASFLRGSVVNDFMPDRMSAAFKFGQALYRSDTDTTAAPRDFFS